MFDENERSDFLDYVINNACKDEISKTSEDAKKQFFQEAKEKFGIDDEPWLEETWKNMAKTANEEIKNDLFTEAEALRKLAGLECQNPDELLKKLDDKDPKTIADLKFVWENFEKIQDQLDLPEIQMVNGVGHMNLNDNCSKPVLETAFERSFDNLLEGITKYYQNKSLLIQHVDEYGAWDEPKRAKSYRRICNKNNKKRCLVIAGFADFCLMRVTEFDLELRILKDGSMKFTGPTAHAAMLKIFPNGIPVPQNEKPAKR